MDAVVCQDPTERPTRLRYERDAILAIKEHALVTDLNVDDTVFRVNTVAQRSGRGKSKCTQSKTQCDRSRDTGTIVLGPQKRTWNTGCHVSYPTGRDTNDTGFTRAGKLSDYRGKERQLGRNPGDFKHDFRGAGRDRGGLRRNEGQSSRGRFHDRHGGQRSGHFAEEPEWFSEGPTTVTETIELGRVLEDEDGDSSVTFARKLATPPISLTDGCDRETDDVSALQNTNPNMSQTGSARSPQSQLQDSPQSSPSGETPGSRFRYLFPKPDVNSDKKTSAINDQLLGLLKGASGQSVSSPEKHNGILIRPESNPNSVLQVENKLRSLLLGHNLPRSTDPFQHKSGQREAATAGNSYTTGPKPKILTVEEIEAQLNLSTKPPVSVPMTNSPHTEIERPTEQPSTLIQTRTSNVTTVPSTSTSNLAPVLHSLAVQQPHQGMCTKQLQLRNPLVPFGILSNPMVRLPSATNAMSASARINQLQHVDPSTTLGVSDSIHQGSTLHQWDSQGNIGKNTSRTSIGSSVINSVLQNCLNTPLLTDFNNRPSNVLHPHTGPIINALTAPRRPIVKAQHTTISLGSALSHMSVTSPSDTAGFDGYTQNMDRRFFHLPASSHFQVPGEPLNAGDKPQLSNLFHTGGDEFCVPSPCGPHLGQPVNALASSNNSNSGSIYLPAKLRASRPQSENSFAFFSQLVEMDRSGVSSLGCPKTSSAFNHLLSASMKAKTLEEIEH
ncbi:hypothetical protein CRM22_001780 [Opisthorchis felineus]|uniref:Eukaryotic translation initiation factor 4E transporter n=1 Tax=Opisthorchis felineus TaxID=147828 RepID=A0A4S2MFE0_OPIFE|nr:hypothetical protein CRM22_001780 [Opisthorchis felineus]TGZ72957.1 hypothetical protein CRM22_001780 [Opisthorchis felineus]